jgi:hypothetical protein
VDLSKDQLNRQDVLALHPSAPPAQTPIPATLRLQASAAVAAKDRSKKIVLTNRYKKVSSDAIQQYNKCGLLKDMDTGGQEPSSNPKEPGNKKS